MSNIGLVGEIPASIINLNNLTTFEVDNNYLDHDENADALINHIQ